MRKIRTATVTVLLTAGLALTTATEALARVRSEV